MRLRDDIDELVDGWGGWNVNGFFVLFLCFIVVCEWV